jgi:tagatose-1,6-bisphosphate aldolase non-catalytic subunit AgaZ/GatZ
MNIGALASAMEQSLGLRIVRSGYETSTSAVWQQDPASSAMRQAVSCATRNYPAADSRRVFLDVSDGAVVQPTLVVDYK